MIIRKPARPFLIGTGTGRCGSRSLAKLLDAQPGLRVTHECMPVLPWEVDTAMLQDRLADLRIDDGNIRGDVASSWLPYLPEVLEQHTDARAVFIWRDRDATVESFIAKMKGKYNHWMHNDGSWRRNERWDPCFPTYAASSLPEAIGMYWDDCWQRSKTLARHFPDRFFTISMDAALNNLSSQTRLLEFCGIDRQQQVTIKRVHENRRPKKGWQRWLAR